jgi:hypothetical protein
VKFQSDNRTQEGGMVKRMVTALALLLFVAAMPGLAYETLTTVFVDGIAPMVMDGNLDDWANIPAQEVPVTHPVEKTRDDAKVIATQGVTDCAFSFKCFADRNYVYFALIVKDDIVLIGRHMYGKGWLDDSNTLYFDGDCVDTGKDYYDANDGQLKVIGNPPAGVKYIEGYIPFFYEGNIPYFWEARGVKSGFRVTGDGYITEIAVPASVLGWDMITAGKIMGANLRVVDKDGDPDDESTDKGYIWAPDPEHTAHFSARSFNRISFATVVPAPEASSQSIQLVQNDDGVSITLGMPDIIKGRTILNEVLADLTIPDFAAAEAKLLPIQSEMWVKPLLGYIQLKKGDIEAGTNQLIDFGKVCPYPWAEEYIQVFLKESVQYMLQNYKGTEASITQEVIDSIVTIIGIFLDRYPTTNVITMNNLKCLHNATNCDYAKYVMFHRKMLIGTKDDNEKLMVYSSLMHKYCVEGEIENLRLLCNEFLASGIVYDDNILVKPYIKEYASLNTLK